MVNQKPSNALLAGPDGDILHNSMSQPVSQAQQANLRPHKLTCSFNRKRPLGDLPEELLVYLTESQKKQVSQLPALARLAWLLSTDNPVTFLDFMAAVNEMVAVSTECDTNSTSEPEIAPEMSGKYCRNCT